MDIREWLGVILPNGQGSVVLYSLYADESADDDSGRFTLAGYLIGSKALARLTEAWAIALGNLDYFHMNERHHKRHPEVYARLLNLMTHDYLTVGFSASVVLQEYDEVMSRKWKNQPMKYWFGSAYSFCVGAIAQMANGWLDTNNPNERNVAYVFESGHSRQGEAGMYLGQVASDPGLINVKKRWRYFSHNFLDGKRRESGALQAADILAWHINNAHRIGRFQDGGEAIIGAVSTLGIHYDKNAIADTLQENMTSCISYREFKSARLIAQASL